MYTFIYEFYILGIEYQQNSHFDPAGRFWLPAKTPKNGFPSTGTLCGAFNRCIFLLRDFENAERL